MYNARDEGWMLGRWISGMYRYAFVKELNYLIQAIFRPVVFYKNRDKE